MERKTRIDAAGAMILLAVMMALGGNQVAIKIVNDGLAPVFQAGLRSLAAIPLVFAFCLVRRTHIDTRKAILIPGLATGFLFASEFALLFQALQWTTVARASVFFYTMPFWVALGAHFLIPGERLTGTKLLGLFLAGAGVIIALSNQNQQVGDYALIGDLMSLLGAMGWAGIALIARTTQFSTLKPEAQLFYQVSVSGILLLPLALFLGETFREPQTFHWIIFACQVVFVVCVAFMTWFWVLSVYPASDMASFSFLAPLFGVLFGWLILDEALTSTILIALVLVGAGIVLVNRKPS